MYLTNTKQLLIQMGKEFHILGCLGELSGLLSRGWGKLGGSSALGCLGLVLSCSLTPGG